MQLVIHNTLSGDRRAVELSGDELLVGRPDPSGAPPAVALKSPMGS